MSVEFAQQTELARINKRARETSSSMQTQSDEEALEDGEKEEPTLRDSLTAGSRLEEVERELVERDTEIRKLKEELQKSAKSGHEQVSVIYSAVICNVCICSPLSTNITHAFIPSDLLICCFH